MRASRAPWRILRAALLPSHFLPTAEVLTDEFKINLLAPACGTILIADATVVRSGRTLTVCTIDVPVERDGSRVACALMRQTLIRIDSAPGADQPRSMAVRESRDPPAYGTTS